MKTIQEILMENPDNSNHIITKKIFLEHLSVVFIFSVLTVIFTFPVILDFASEAAGFDVMINAI